MEYASTVIISCIGSRYSPGDKGVKKERPFHHNRTPEERSHISRNRVLYHCDLWDINTRCHAINTNKIPNSSYFSQILFRYDSKFYAWNYDAGNGQHHHIVRERREMMRTSNVVFKFGPTLQTMLP